MDNMELKFVISSSAASTEGGFKDATDAIRTLGQAFEELTRKQDQSTQSTQTETTTRRQSTTAAQEQAKAEKEAAQARESTIRTVGQHVVALGALVTAVRKVNDAIESSIEAYKDARSAFVGLESIAQGVGTNMAALESDIQDLTKSGLIPMADAVTALKNLLSRGYSTKQAVTTIKRLTDAAAFGRQANLDLGEAVRTATEGLRNENSVLVDNAGVTKNVAKMWKEYADARGLAAQELTQAQKIEAEYLGIMQETQYQVGDSAKLADEYAGAQARAAAETQRLMVALGDAATTGAKPLAELMGHITGGLADVLEKSPEATAGLVAFGRGAITTTTAVAALRVVVSALNAEVAASAGIFGTAGTALKSLVGAIGPVGWAIVGVGTAITAIFSVISANARKSREEFQALQADVANSTAEVRHQAQAIAKYEELSAKGSKATAQETEELRLVSQQLVETYGERVGYLDDEGNAIVTNVGAAKALLDAEKQVTLEKIKQLDSELAKQQAQLASEKFVKQADFSRTQGELENLLATQRELAEKMEKAKADYQSAIEDHITDIARDLYGLEEPVQSFEELLSKLPDTIRQAFELDVASSGTEQALDNLYEKLSLIMRLPEESKPQLGDFLSAGVEAQAENVNDALDQYREDHEKLQAELDKMAEEARQLQRERTDLMIEQATRQVGEISQALKDSIFQAMEDVNLSDEGSAGMVDNFIARYFSLEDGVADEILNTTIPQIQELRDQLIASLATSDVDTGEGSNLINQLFGEIGGADQLAELQLKGQELAEALAQGTATPTQAQAFDALQGQMQTVLSQMTMSVQAMGTKLDIPIDKPLASLKALQDQAAKTSEEVVKEAAKVRASKESFESMSSSVLKAADNLSTFADATKDIAAMREAVAIVRKGEEASEDYAGALEYLTEQTGLSKDAVLDSLDALDNEIDLKETLLEANLATAQAEALFAQATIQAMIEAGTVTAEQGGQMIAVLDDVIAKLKEIDGVRISLKDRDKNSKEIKVDWPWSGGGGGGGGGRGGGRRGGGGGGGGSQKNTALDNALKDVERQKRRNEITLQEEINLLEQIKAQHAKTAEEIASIDDKLYDLRKTKRRQDYEDALAMDQLTLQDQIQYTEQEMALYKEGTEAYRELAKRKYDLQNQLRQQEYDLAVYYNELSLEDQLKKIEEMAEQYKEGTQARIELEKQAYDLRIQMAQQYYDMMLFLGQMSHDQQIAMLEQQLEQVAVGSQRYIDIYKQLTTAKRDQRRQAYDTAIYYGQLTLEQQRDFLMQEMQMYAAGSQQRIEIEKQVYAVLKQMRDQQIQEIREQHQEQMQALQKWYQAQVKATNQYYDDQIKRVQELTKAKTDAIKAEIRALQRAKRQEDRSAERSRRTRDIEALKQRIMYEHDEYNKRKLTEQLGREETDFKKWQRDIEVADRIEALNLEMQAIQAHMQQEIQLLNEKRQRELEYLQERYQRLQEQLQMELEAKIAKQEEWLEMMAGYLESYQEVGAMLGKGYADAFIKEAQAAVNFIGSMGKGAGGPSISPFYEDLRFKQPGQLASQVASQAADAVLKTKTPAGTRTERRTIFNQKTGESRVGDVLVNINQPVKSPVQVGREVKRAVQAATKLRR